MTGHAPPSAHQSPTDPGIGRRLAILHVLRAPVGGLFRHVLDLARGQAAAGHRVGIVCTAQPQAPHVEAQLEELAAARGMLALGLHRLSIRRLPSPLDVTAIAAVRARACELEADILHGHGAKGGLLARLGRPAGARTIYTPHGGALHFEPTSPAGLVYLTAERMLRHRTDAFIFESAFAQACFIAKVGAPGRPAFVVHNGVGEADFRPLPAHTPTDDVAFVGEMRLLKGVDVLLEALALLRQQGRQVTAVLAGDGPDRPFFMDLACELGLAPHVRFPGVVPAREVMAQARLLTVPSLGESLPYVVLEAAAAGVPLVATKVGGIPEILSGGTDRLVSPGDAPALAAAIARVLDAPETARAEAAALRADIARRFSLSRMVAEVEEVYRTILAARPQKTGNAPAAGIPAGPRI